jgi:hypothetical protein
MNSKDVLENAVQAKEREIMAAGARFEQVQRERDVHFLIQELAAKNSSSITQLKEEYESQVESLRNELTSLKLHASSTESALTISKEEITQLKALLLIRLLLLLSRHSSSSWKPKTPT